MPVRMMLASDELRTVLVSIHVSLRDAIAAVTEANVLQTCRSPMRRCCAPWGARRASLWQGSTPMPARVACSAARRSKSLLPLWRNCARKGMDVHGPLRPTRCSCALATPQACR
jgi:4-hydroxythreonine-4-phosphate dehydrogenase